MNINFDAHVRFRTAVDVIKQLEAELYHARASWSVFEAGNGLDKSSRASLHELINNTYANHTYGHIIRSAASMTVLSISRITDNPRPQRYTIGGLQKVIIAQTDLLSESAGNWFPDWPEKSNKDKVWARTEARQISDLIDQFTGSEELKRIRALRNEALAHRLTVRTVRPTFNDIGVAFKSAHEIISRSSTLILGNNWNPNDFFDVQLSYANEFWDALERGLSC